ncbi:helix-turn-helix transcriptional regulator [Streptomyces sp. LRE541]|uniref:helix-turn-helix transcriptional regulator n=1 Tax=Streptomyces sp. LRE541 TaxID=2931983 RepID=UPI00200DCEAE|nr:helix-turn-helix transcriptional regulator [Streptomyces sp. LRE541]UPZ26658.1 helix-turn-helix transcriptional regulator [Streptomyces sp. LRE541]
MNSGELGRFLRTRREAVQPADVGLSTGARRRTPGLRRSEVALLADISVDYYERLEQARAGRPSVRLLTVLATVLKLDDAEGNYLHNLAGYPASAAPDTEDRVEPELRFLLDSLIHTPAHVVDDLSNVLAQNRLSVMLFGPWAQQTGRRVNAIWRWFTEPEARTQSFLEDDPAVGRQYAAILRSAWAARGHDRVSSDLVTDLLASSAEFQHLWEDMDVGHIQSTHKELVHQRHGRFEVSCDTIRSATTTRSLLVMRPLAGTGTARRFEALSASAADHAGAGSPTARQVSPSTEERPADLRRMNRPSSI